MKVLVINGSPRAKGNSDILCDEFIRGAEEAGHQVEKISLREKSISPCKACYACFRTGPCVQKDDMAEILKKADNADVFLLASPTYFLTMSGQMKVMIDRLLPRWQDLGGKEAYVIVTGHDGKKGLERNAEDLVRILENLGDRVLTNFHNTDSEKGYYENLKDYFLRAEKYHFFMKPAVMMCGQNCLKNYMLEHPFEWDLQYHEKWYERNAGEKPVMEELRFFTKYHSMASAGMTIEWIKEDMPVSPEIMAKRITNLRRIGLGELLKDTEDKEEHPYGTA